MKTPNQNRTAEAGLSLVEILVAVAILAVAAVIALTVYDVSRKAFKEGENTTEQQQAVRIAFDRLSADLRMTGFNYNPDGSKARNDEQIEAAYDTGVVIRADFDAEFPSEASTPEDTLKGTDFLAVSVGNDEIVAYVLAKPDGSSTETLTFNADISNPRDGTVETVDLPNVAMVHDDPPYTLYRVTFNNNAATYPGSSFFVRTPLIENVYAMNFRYFDTTGVQTNSMFDLTTIAEDIGGAETTAAQRLRTNIRRYGVELVGLTRDPDTDFNDENDPIVATRAYRKFELAGDITPRNMGMVGVKDISSDVVPPGQPGAPTLTPGHCGGLYINWTANPVGDEVSHYLVNYGTTSGSTGSTRTATSTSYYLGGLADAQTYYVALQAVDTSGNVSIKSTETAVATVDVNVPDAPSGGVATAGLNGAINVSWNPVTQNTSSQPAADPYAPLLRDLEGYRVYRGKDNNFNSATTYLWADESVIGDSNSPSYPDTKVVNCRTYYYWATAIDECANESGPSGTMSGSSYSDVAPHAPKNLQAFYSGLGQVDLEWEAVGGDVDGADIFIDGYRVYRSPPMPKGVIPLDDYSYQFIGEVKGDPVYHDALSLPAGMTIFYRVTAIDDCYNESVMSEPAEPSCAFAGDVAIEHPQNDSPVAGVVPIVVAAIDGGDERYAKLTLEFYHREQGMVKRTQEIVDPGPTWYYEWLADPPGPYTITATVENELGCSKSTTIDVAAGYDVGCCLSPPNPDLRPIVLDCIGSGSAKCATIQYEVINNNCLTAVSIEAMVVDWQDVTGNQPLLSGVRFDGNLIWNVVPPKYQPAGTLFSDPKPSIGVERGSANPVRVSYRFTDNMARRQGPNLFRNTLTTGYKFRLLDASGNPTSIVGTCGPSTNMFDAMIVEAP